MHTYEQYKCIAEDIMTKQAEDWYSNVLKTLGERSGRTLIGGGIGAGLGYLAGESPMSALAGGVIGGGLGYLSGGLGGGEKTPEEKSKDLINKEYAKEISNYDKSKEPGKRQDFVRQHNYDSMMKQHESDYDTGKTSWIGKQWNTLGTKYHGWLSDVALDNDRYEKKLKNAPIERFFDRALTVPVTPYAPFKIFPKLISYMHGDKLSPTTNQYSYKDQSGKDITKNYSGTIGQLNAKRKNNLTSLLPNDWTPEKKNKYTHTNSTPITNFSNDVIDQEGIDAQYNQITGGDQQ